MTKCRAGFATAFCFNFVLLSTRLVEKLQRRQTLLTEYTIHSMRNTI